MQIDLKQQQKQNKNHIQNGKESKKSFVDVFYRP